MHTSNYRIVGFTSEVSLDELADSWKGKRHSDNDGPRQRLPCGFGALWLARRDNGSRGSFQGHRRGQLQWRQAAGRATGGDFAGRADLIEKMRTNPLARALRMDKLTLAGLEATLEEYLRPEGPAKGIPTLDMIMRAPAQLEESARKFVRCNKESGSARAEMSVEPGIGRVGGGALPMSDLPGPRVAIRPRKISVARLEQDLRSGEPPVIGIIKDEALLLDPRTLLKDQAALIPNLVGAALAKNKNSAIKIRPACSDSRVGIALPKFVRRPN